MLCLIPQTVTAVLFFRIIRCLLFEMIVGYVEDDREIISEVNGKAFKTLILIAILGVALYYLIKLAIYIWDWFWGLFT